MLYLDINELEVETDDKVFEYSWGVRAENEVSINKIEKFYQDVSIVFVL